jgi:hypothetical protein
MHNTLIDDIIINKKRYIKPATVIELGLSHHQAQVLPVLNKTWVSVNKRVLKRFFRENNTREFKYLLFKETWQEVLTETEVNAKFDPIYALFFCHSLPSRVYTWKETTKKWNDHTKDKEIWQENETLEHTK